MRQIVYGSICLLGDPRFISYDKPTDTWSLNEGALREHLCAVANVLSLADGDSLAKKYEKGVRLLPWSPWGEHPHGLSSQFQPYMMNADRTKFDLEHFNTWYFPIVKRVIAILNEYGFRVWWCLFDNCQFTGGFEKWSPWSTNTQGITSVYDPKAFQDPDEEHPVRVNLFKAWWKECIAKFKGLKVGWAWSNEGNKVGMLALAKGGIFPILKSSTSFDPKFMTYGATMEPVEYHPEIPVEQGGPYPGNAGMLDILKGVVGTLFGDKTKLAIWKEVHSIGGKGYPAIPNRLHQATVWWLRESSNGIRVWLSNDGVFDGDSECDTEIYEGKLRRRPSAKRMVEIIMATKGYGNDITWEHLPKTEDMICILNTLRAMFKALFGKEPTAKYHYEPPPPTEYVMVVICTGTNLLPNLYCPNTAQVKFLKGTEPTLVCTLHKEPVDPPEPPQPPTPPTQSCVDKYIKNRPLSKWQIGKWFKCWFFGVK
jgi:hypothetical protein